MATFVRLSAIEYLLIVAVLSIVIVAVVQRFGIALNSIFMTLDQDTVIITSGS